MNDPKSSSPKEAESAREAMRSPVRPNTPKQTEPLKPPVQPSSVAPETPTEHATPNPTIALNTLRRKMEEISDEFANGKINRVQFYALYKRYNEQRTIIERLLERNPNSDAWKQVISVKGQTGFLRHYYEAQPLCFLVYRHNQITPISVGGKRPPQPVLVQPVLKQVWGMPNRPKTGLGRKPLGETEWLILALGEYAATAVIFSLEPSAAQARVVRDLHADFERANQAALARGWIVPERMVFPQRALIEESL